MEKPFHRSDPSNKPCQLVRDKLHLVFHDDGNLVLDVHPLQEIFRQRQQCLIHGDVHSGSVMVRFDDVKVKSPFIESIPQRGCDFQMDWHNRAIAQMRMRHT